MANNVSSVYINVIDDVIDKVRGEFISSGAGAGVLSELQALWETKMMQFGVISGNIERQAIQRPAVGPITLVHDLNVPYEGPIEEFETPTAEMLFPPTPLQTPMQTPMLQTPGSVDHNIPTGTSDFTPVNDIRNDIDIKVGRPSPYMQPPSPWMNQRPLGADVNVAFDEGHNEVERGASHQPLNQANEFQNSSGNGREIAIGAAISGIEAKAGPVLPQQDGIHDEYDNLFPCEGVATEDYNTVNTPADNGELQAATPSVGTPNPTKSEALDDDEPPLNEDDDDDDDLDELERGEEEPQTQDLVLAQFEKVTRTKSRWKCTLKDGIMHLNNRDILFNKATGEFDF